LFYEGEYLNGERNGKGKEYNYNGELIFDGEYKEGEKWNGIGKEYNNNGQLIFEGEFIEGKRNIKFNQVLDKYINFWLKIDNE